MPKDQLAKELDTSVLNIDEMIKESRDELASVMVHRQVAAQIFEPLNRVRMTRLQQQVMDKIENALEFNEMTPSNLIDLYKFATKHLSDDTSKSDDPLADLNDEEIHERALRLLDGGKSDQKAG